MLKTKFSMRRAGQFKCQGMSHISTAESALLVLICKKEAESDQFSSDGLPLVSAKPVHCTSAVDKTQPVIVPGLAPAHNQYTVPLQLVIVPALEQNHYTVPLPVPNQ